MALNSIAAYGNGGNQVMNDLASQLAAQNEQSASTRTAALGGYGAVRDQIQELLALVPRSGDKLSFKDLFDYRDKLTEELTTQVRGDLEVLGVDFSQDVTLGLDKAGRVVAMTGHPDKALVDQYFKANPELADRYAEALKVNSLANLAQNKASPATLRASLQQSSMQAWFADQGANSLFSGSLATSMSSWDSMYSGISAMV